MPYGVIGTPGTTAVSKQNVTTASVHVRGSYDFERDKGWYLRPMIDAGVTYVQRGGFTEQGAGAANLNVASGSNTAVSLQPSLELGREYVAANGTLIRPFAMFGVTRFLSGTTPAITASLQGAPAGLAPFTMEGRMDRTYGDVGLGVDMLTRDGMTFRLSYSGQFSSHSSYNGLSLKLAISF